MTINEAIEQLQINGTKEPLTLSGSPTRMANYFKALDMAVKALEKQAKVDNIIKRLEEEMYVDKNGNNVLQGGTIDYEQRYKYEIGCNYGLTKAIKIVKDGGIGGN